MNKLEVDGLVIEFAEGVEIDDPRVKKQVNDARAAVRANPLLKYFPHTKQEAFHAHRCKTKVYIGGTRAGKSTAGVLDDLIQLLDDIYIPEHLKDFKIWQPPFKLRVITPDFGATLSSILDTFRLWTPQGALVGGSWEKAYRERDHQLYFANESSVDFLTLEQDVNKFGGVTRNRIHYDEEPQGEKGEKIRWQGVTRLAEVHGDELFTYSPINGLGWTHDEFEEKKGAEEAKDVWANEKLVVVKASIHDNPHLSEEGIRDALDKIPANVRASFEFGDYVHFKGLVYPMFDRGVHVVERPDKKHVQSFVELESQYDGIDPGMQTTAILFAGFDKDNVLLIFDELYLSGRWAIPENAAEMIRAKRQSWGLPEHPRTTLIDPSARNRSLTDADSVQMAYWRAKIKTVHANNDREAGVFEVMRRLEHRGPKDVRQPLLLISENCTHLLREIRRYRLQPKEDGSFDVVKRDDHGADVMRYIAQARPLARKRFQPLEQNIGWIPGTAPPYRPKKHVEHGPLGVFT